MARMFRRRRTYGFKRRYKGLRARLLRRRLLIRKKIKKFVNKMGYPSYVKMIGMTESKRLLLRKTLMLSAPVSTTKEKNPNSNIFQIVLNPLECPNIERAYDHIAIKAEGSKISENNTPVTNPIKEFRRFKYDYIRIKNIFISIKPAQTVSNTNGTSTEDVNNLYGDNGDTPISNVYAYFTYKFPMLSSYDNNDEGNRSDIVERMYSTNPDAERILKEGKMKNTYTWPCNKAMTISLNKLYYRVSTEPFKLCSNSPLDLQFLSTLSNDTQGIYNPFDFKYDLFNKQINHGLEEENEEFENKKEESDSDIEMLGATNNDASVQNIPDMGMSYYNLFFGRLVIVAPKRVRFTTEICYDCVLLR